ncbi:MAG: VOC family protein [Candidatus Limnocylindrales bacterium]
MAQATTAIKNKPAWVELSTSDPEAARTFYARLFGWRIEVSDDPQYGGYALAKIGDQDAAGIGRIQSPEAPTAWSIYIGSDDVDALATKIQAAGGRVIAAPFDVGDQGRMAVFQDPCGAFISGWQATAMRGFSTDGPNAFSWAELNARGVEKAIPFYETVFGWSHRTTEMGGDAPPYTEFQVDGESIAGAMEMNPMVPAQVPSYWMAYFEVGDVDAAFRRALDAGAREMVPPGDFPGGRFAIVSDPQGAAFGLLQTTGR